MNGFLVVARCRMDDVPMALFDTRFQAEQFAAELTEERIVEAAGDVMAVDVTDPGVVVGIVEFRNCTPTPIDLIRTDEE